MRRPDPRALAADWSAPLLLALLTVLGALQLLDALDVVYYPMIHGATSTMRFDLGLSLVPSLLFLFLIWLGWVIWKRHFRALPFPVMAVVLYPFASLEAVVSTGSLLAVVGGLWAYRSIGKYLSGVLALLGSIEAIALLHWAVFLPLGLSSPFRWYANLEMGLFYMAAHLAPFLAILLMYLWVFKLLLHWRYGNMEKQEGYENRVGKRASRQAILMLLFSISLSIIAALYPHLPSVNPKNRNVGVDFQHYVNNSIIVEKDISQVFNVSRGSRPIIYILIYSIQKLLGLDAIIVVRNLPIFLNPLLIISIYFLTKEIFEDEWIASWSAFFTVCGIQVVVGIFSFFLTNMLALSFLFFSLGLLFRSLRCECFISIISASIIGGLLVFTHPWTYDQYYIPVVLIAGIIFYNTITKYNDYLKVKMILIYIFCLGFSEFINILIVKGFGGLSASTSVMNKIIPLSKFWPKIIFGFRRHYCGLMSNIILISLIILGIYILRDYIIPELFLIFVIAVASIIFLVGDYNIKNRLLYNLPIGLFASRGYYWLLERKCFKNFKNVLSLYVVLIMILYLFRSLANFT